MNDDSLRDAFASGDSDSPTDEHRFLEALEGRLSAGWDGTTADESTGSTAGAAATTSMWSEHDGVEYLAPAPETIGEVVAETPSRSKRSRWIAIGAIVATAALIGGVVYVRNRDDEPATIANIAAATSDAKTARMSYEIAMSQASASVTMRGEGTIDFEAQAGTMELSYDLGGSVFEIAGDGLSSSQQKMQVIFRGKDAWLKGGFASFFSNTDDPKRDKWFHTTQTGDDSSDGGVTTMFLGGRSTLDPVGMLESLQKHGTLTAVGTETLHGDKTTKYRLTASRHDLNPKVRSTTPVSIDIWADDSLRLRKLQAGTAVTGPMGATTFEFWDFGVKVDTAPPAKADVTEEATQSLETFGDRTKITGDWEKHWAGSDGGVTWELWNAAAENSTCWSLHTNPPLSSPESLVELNPGPDHGDDSSTCVNASRGATTIGSGTSGTNRVIALVGLAPTVTIELADGSQATRPTNNGSFVLIFDRNAPVEKLTSGDGDAAIVCRAQNVGQFEIHGDTVGTLPNTDGFGGFSCGPAAFDDLMQGPGKLSADWRKLVAGTDAGVAWSFATAPARDGWECFGVQTTPLIARDTSPEWVGIPFNSNSKIEYGGEMALCRPVPHGGGDATTNLFDFNSDVMIIAESDGGNVPALLALKVADGYTSATITFADKSTRDADIDPKVGALVVVSAQKITSVVVHNDAGDYICERQSYDDDGNAQPAPASSTEPITCQADGI